MKKIILIICIFILVGCTKSNINTLTLKEIVENQIGTKTNLYNVNSKGFKYFKK